MPEQKKVRVGVGIFILNNNKVLLGKRHGDPKKASSLLKGAGTWTMPGGKMDFGETFEECAKRETFEESGIRLKSLKVICVNNDKVSDAHFVTVGLFSDDFEGKPKVMEPEKITEWHWFSLDELPEPLFFPTKKVLENYHKNAFYLEE